MATWPSHLPIMSFALRRDDGVETRVVIRSTGGPHISDSADRTSRRNLFCSGMILIHQRRQRYGCSLA